MDELVQNLHQRLKLMAHTTSRLLARYNETIASPISPDGFELAIEEIMWAVWRCNNNIGPAIRDLDGVAYDEANQGLVYGLLESKEAILSLLVATGMIYTAIMDERDAAAKEARAESMQLALSRAFAQMDEVRATNVAQAAAVAVAEAEDYSDEDFDEDEELGGDGEEEGEAGEL